MLFSLTYTEKRANVLQQDPSTNVKSSNVNCCPSTCIPFLTEMVENWPTCHSNQQPSHRMSPHICATCTNLSQHSVQTFSALIKVGTDKLVGTLKEDGADTWDGVP